MSMMRAFEQTNELGVPVIIDRMLQLCVDTDGLQTLLVTAQLNNACRLGVQSEVQWRLAQADWSRLDRGRDELPRRREPKSHNIDTHYDDSLLSRFDPLRAELALAAVAALPEDDGTRFALSPAEKTRLSSEIRKMEMGRLRFAPTLPMQALVVCCPSIARMLPHGCPLYVVGALAKVYAAAERKVAVSDRGGRSVSDVPEVLMELVASDLHLDKERRPRRPSAERTLLRELQQWREQHPEHGLDQPLPVGALDACSRERLADQQYGLTPSHEWEQPLPTMQQWLCESSPEFMGALKAATRAGEVYRQRKESRRRAQAAHEMAVGSRARMQKLFGEMIQSSRATSNEALRLKLERRSMEEDRSNAGEVAVAAEVEDRESVAFASAMTAFAAALANVEAIASAPPPTAKEMEKPEDEDEDEDEDRTDGSSSSDGESSGESSGASGGGSGEGGGEGGSRSRGEDGSGSSSDDAMSAIGEELGDDSPDADPVSAMTSLASVLRIRQMLIRQGDPPFSGYLVVKPEFAWIASGEVPFGASLAARAEGKLEWTPAEQEAREAAAAEQLRLRKARKGPGGGEKPMEEAKFRRLDGICILDATHLVSVDDAVELE